MESSEDRNPFGREARSTEAREHEFRPLSGVNYFFYLTTIISPYQRQLLFDSSLGARSARFRAQGGALLCPPGQDCRGVLRPRRSARLFWAGRAGKADPHTFFFCNPFLSS